LLKGVIAQNGQPIKRKLRVFGALIAVDQLS
jgi:hypothetical protein